ncbi:MAG: hypothetical protein H0V66_10395 [Bdellovibrionales bacterium]|nr:hypothetical protein [Bdellovibrionales bacterium]
MQLYLNFHNHIILVSSNEEATIRKLQEEFHYFVRAEASIVQTNIEIFKEIPPVLPSMVAVKILETCSIYKIGPSRYIDYRGEALTIWDKQEESVRIYSLDVDRLYEIAFLAIHSILGQELEKKGICRVHALGVSLGKVNSLVMLPSKGGKSTLLSYLLENPEVKILSDDMPLIDLTGRIHIFPSKISVDKKPEDGALAKLNWTEFVRTQYPPKWTAGLSQLKNRIETNNLHHKNLLIAGFRLSKGQSILTPVPKWKIIGPVFEHMIMGVGLPQVIEMFLNFNWTDILKLIYHSIIRSFCAFQMIRRAKCYHFYLGPDRAYNAQLLLDQMYDQQNS